jgi:hypothetical protein
MEAALVRELLGGENAPLGNSFMVQADEVPNAKAVDISVVR